MIHLFRSELFRLSKRPQTWLLLLVAFGLTALMYGGFVLGARITDPQDANDFREVLTFQQLPDFGLSLGLGFFGSVMVIIVAAGLMGNEYSWNTLRPLTARARSRVGLMTAKILTGLLYSAVFMVLLGILTAGLSILSSALAGIDAEVSGDAAMDAARFTGKIIISNLPYVAFAFMLATVARSNAAGIAGSLGLSFIEQPMMQLLRLASDIFEDVERFGIAYSVNELVFPQGDVDIARPVTILLAYMVLFFGISYAVFHRRDVVSG
jgi:ABC-2 type transport system permease protein